VRLAPQPYLGADFARHTSHFAGERVELIHHRVDGVLDLKDLAADIDGDLLPYVAIGYPPRHLGHVAQLHREVAGHRVDRVGEVLPCPPDSGNLSLTAQPPISTDFTGDPRHCAGERVQLVDHRVDGFLEEQNFAALVHRDLLGEVAAGDRRRHVGNVSHLRGEVAGHEV